MGRFLIWKSSFYRRHGYIPFGGIGLEDSSMDFDTGVGLNEVQSLKKDQIVPKDKVVLLWIDGYVDHRMQIVAKRDDIDEYRRMGKMEEFGKRITDAAGRGLSTEWIVLEKKAGGFCSNTGRALGRMQVPTKLISHYGKPNIRPVFEEIGAVCEEIVSIGEPVDAHCVEFRDGKILLMGSGGPLDFSWERVENEIGREGLIGYLEGADLFGQGYWSLIPKMNEVWKKLIEEVFPSLPGEDKHMFLDLADVNNKSKEELERALPLIEQFEDYFHVTLSLNEPEVKFLTQTLDLDWGGGDRESILKVAEKIKSKIQISNLVIHTPHFAVSASPGSYDLVNHAYEPDPKITTAAGDHFNAGYILGLLNDLRPAGRLILGNSNTGYFVRNDKTPNLDEVLNFVQDYGGYY